MRATFIILFFVFYSIFVQGQNSVLQTKLIDENYSYPKILSNQLDSFYFGLQPINKTKYKYHIRISLTGQIIDFYSSNNIDFLGTLINYTIEYKTVKDKENDSNKSMAYQYVIEHINLEQLLVDSIVKKILITGLSKIPTDSLINSWQLRFHHCNNLIFQFNLNGKYTEQIFHCPWEQEDTIKFKKEILDNYQTLKSLFKLDSLYEDFESKLSKGKTYSKDGYEMRFIMTNKQLRNWSKSKPKRDFMKMVKDSVDTYIDKELKKQKIEVKDVNCFQYYRLTFGINGKLKKVTTSRYETPKLKNSLGLSDYLADKKEIRKCKLKVIQIFKKIDLSFLNFESEIYRTFSFENNNEYLLIDDTMY